MMAEVVISNYLSEGKLRYHLGQSSEPELLVNTIKYNLLLLMNTAQMHYCLTKASGSSMFDKPRLI